MPDATAASPGPAPLEARLPCPVCLGVQMDKVRMGRHPSWLVLDHCTRCGGVWLEKGEAGRLARFPAAELWRHVAPLQSPPRPPCHGCHAPLDRDAGTCAACGTVNVLRCPHCDRTMERRQHSGVTLDVCTKCEGVWFDNAELKSIWIFALSRQSTAKRGGRGTDALLVGGDVLLESMFWAPHLTLNAGAAVAQGIGSAAGALGSVSLEGAASAAGGAAEALGGAAEGVFEMILSIISGIFDS